jgi:hypothetical protein
MEHELRIPGDGAVAGSLPGRQPAAERNGASRPVLPNLGALGQITTKLNISVVLLLFCTQYCGAGKSYST